MVREDAQGGGGRDLDFLALFQLGSVDRMTAGSSSATSLIYQIFIPLSDS